MFCKGVLLDGTPCVNQPLENGFCVDHQQMATEFLIRNLTIIQKELQDLEGITDASMHETVKSKIHQLKASRRLFGAQCAELETCKNQLRDLAIDIDLLLSPDGVNYNPPEMLMHAKRNLSDISQEGIDRTLDEFSLKKMQKEENLLRLDDLQSKLVKVSTSAEQQRAEAQIAFANLQQSLNENKQQREKNQLVQHQLENALANAQGHAASITGVYVEDNARLQDELSEIKENYRVLQARELELDTQLREWEKSEMVLNSQVRELRDSYESKISNLQTDYANKVNRGEHILSQRESELMRDLNGLENALKVALGELEQANSKTEEAQAFLQTSECGNLASELLSVNERLRYATSNMSRLQQERDLMVTERARLEVQFQRRLKEGQSSLNDQLSKMNNDMQLKNQEIMSKHQELTNLHARFQNSKTQSENEVSQLKMKLQQTQFELRNFQNAKSQQDNLLAEKERMMNDGLNSRKTQMDFAYQKMKSDLDRKYESAIKNLEAQKLQTQTSQDERQRDLMANQSRLQNKEKILIQQQQRLDQSNAEYQSKMQLYQSQSDELNAAIAQSRQRGDLLQVAERDFKLRLEEVRRTSAVDREQFLKEKELLSSQLQTVREAYSTIQNGLSACSTARDALILNANQLKIENDRMKIQFSQLEAQYANSRAQSTLVIEKLRTDANKMRTTLANATNALDSVPAIHAHNKELESQMKQYQQQVIQHQSELTRVKSDIQKVLAERQFASQRSSELENLLKACSASKQFLQVSNAQTSEQVRDLQRLNNQVVGLAEENANSFAGLISQERKESDHKLASLSRELSKKNYDLKNENQISKRKTQELINMAKQRQDMAMAMADASVVSSHEIQSLVPLSIRFGDPLPVGRSRLLGV